jgi:predicted small lipoprotein YifL
MRSLALVAVAALLAAACGQRGPLYLRDRPPPGINPPKVESYQPVPYPADTERAP